MAVAALAPEITLAEYRQDFVGPARCADLADFLTRPPRFVSLLQGERGLRMFVEDLFDQLIRDSVIYVEIRFAPLLHTERSLTPETAVAIVPQATAEAIAAPVSRRASSCVPSATSAPSRVPIPYVS
ncbi:hypothetical protein Ais01nite_74860 [Asanoa ishikariensis]|uniref:Adenosine deaminase n=1 Tax=Asanoa ishikariensis TaxID=137265 RepID=A0A1H3UTL5_9ACTN|nr:hypothetical protein [Asanoa ishikariensis]GIF69451.1 hypothetical protein Ais01nite_74860 [Asanoa ishikariensis]SDZ65371.1 adenosine deaminase [Asanoa ishikariensis]